MKWTIAISNFKSGAIVCFNSMSMKVPKIVEEAKAALNGGFSVVIGLQTTGEV